MRTLTFEQLRINLTLTFDTLDEPIEIVKRGKVVGYLVSNLQDNKGTGKSEKQPSNDKPAPEIVAVTSSCEGKNPSIEPETGKTNHILKSAKELREAYKARFPLQLCIKCQQFNRDCVC